MSVKFLEESQTKMWFDPENMTMEDGLMQIASVLQGEESSVETAEAVGHFLIGAMRGNPLVERLIDTFSATDGKMSGEEAQELVFRGGTVDNNPFYREDFDISAANAVEAAGIVLGRQLIEPMMNPESKNKHKEWAGKKGMGILNLIRRLGMWVFRQFRFVNKKYANDMIKAAREQANDIVSQYLKNEADLGENLRQDFLDNTDTYGT